MSVETLAIVLHHSRAKSTAKLVLVGVANHDGDGGAWPSVVTLSRYAGVHPRNVQRALVKLQELGELRVDTQQGGLAGAADHDRPNLYHVLLRCPLWCDGSKHHRDTRKRGRSPQPHPQLGDEGVAQASPGGAGATPPLAQASPGGVAQASPEPSLETNHEHRGTPTVTSLVGPTARVSQPMPACSVCAQPAARCMRVPAHVSGHTYTHPHAQP